MTAAARQATPGCDFRSKVIWILYEFCFKVMNSVLKMIQSVLKMTNVCSQRRTHSRVWPRRRVTTATQRWSRWRHKRTVFIDKWSYSSIEMKILPLIRWFLGRAGYTEAVALDASTGMVSEGSGQNIFVVKDGTVITPPINGSNLSGLTRGSVVQICQAEGIRICIYKTWILH